MNVSLAYLALNKHSRSTAISPGIQHAHCTKTKECFGSKIRRKHGQAWSLFFFFTCTTICKCIAFPFKSEQISAAMNGVMFETEKRRKAEALESKQGVGYLAQQIPCRGKENKQRAHAIAEKKTKKESFTLRCVRSRMNAKHIGALLASHC